MLTCDICNFETIYKPSLTMHMKVKHIEDQNILNCTKCSYTTVIRDYLKRHMKQHKEEREFACQTCNKKFHMKCQLDQHMRVVHYKSSPCWLCGETLNSEILLNSHIQSYHPNETTRFQCNRCFEKFYVEYCFASHMRKFHPASNVICTEKGCNLEFRQKKSMLRHVENDHRKEHVSSLNTKRSAF